MILRLDSHLNYNDSYKMKKVPGSGSIIIALLLESLVVQASYQVYRCFNFLVR